MKISILVCLVLLSAFSQVQADEPILVIGDKAPSFHLSEWIQGERVESLETGKVYVIEFWASWCGPCVDSIPHLAELQNKYENEVIVIGANGSERLDTPEEELDRIKEFVRDHSDTMDYRVAYADPSFMKNWQLASQSRGIPNAIVVDQEGNIAWIGHPLLLDKPLEAIVQKTWNLQQARENHLKQQQEAFAEKKYMDEVTPLIKLKDWKKVIELSEAFLAEQLAKNGKREIEQADFIRWDSYLKLGLVDKIAQDIYENQNEIHGFAMLQFVAPHMTHPLLKKMAAENQDQIREASLGILARGSSIPIDYLFFTNVFMGQLEEGLGNDIEAKTFYQQALEHLPSEEDELANSTFEDIKKLESVASEALVRLAKKVSAETSEGTPMEGQSVASQDVECPDGVCEIPEPDKDDCTEILDDASKNTGAVD